jgi:hypothetical protein
VLRVLAPTTLNQAPGVQLPQAASLSASLLSSNNSPASPTLRPATSRPIATVRTPADSLCNQQQSELSTTATAVSTTPTPKSTGKQQLPQRANRLSPSQQSASHWRQTANVFVPKQTAFPTSQSGLRQLTPPQRCHAIHTRLTAVRHSLPSLRTQQSLEMKIAGDLNFKASYVLEFRSL